MPTEPTNEFLRLLQVLTEAGVEFAVVGGAAAILHGASTATYDLDVAMPFTVSNCERLLLAVGPLHPRLSHTPDKRPLLQTAQELASFHNLYLLTDLGRLDVLGSVAPAGTAAQVLSEAQLMDVGGVNVRVVTLSTLIQVKAAMNRPKDKQVEIELRAIAAIRSAQGP